MATSLLDTGLTAVISGKVDASSGTDAVLTTTDGAASMSRAAAGEYTITFGQNFNSAPVVVATPVISIGTATASTDVVVCSLESVTVSDFTIQLLDVVGGTDATDGVQSDAADFHFIVIGSRNR